MASDDDNDEALVARARRGDDDALAALYRRHRDWVLRIATRVTDDCDDALDVLQDTFAYLFRKLGDPTFTLSATLRGLLHPTVRHLALDRLRRRRRSSPGCTTRSQTLRDVLRQVSLQGGR